MPEKKHRDIIWLRSLYNGLLAWLLAIFVYVIPGFIIATKMGFDLGRQGYDSTSISTEISQHMSDIYQNSLWLSIFLIVSTCFFIFWRTRKVTKKHGGNGIKNGLFVSVFSVFLTIVMLLARFEWLSLVEIFLYTGIGYLSGLYFNTKQKTLESPE